MCAVYGLGGGPRGAGGPPRFLPFDERATREAIAEWADEQASTARITGRNSRNLNPLIMAPDGSRGVVFAWWWLWPNGSGPAGFNAFNARDDKLTSRWRTYLGRRAIVPATWYVEKGTSFELPGGEAFGIAAITHTVVEQTTGEELTTYALVTREAVDEAAAVHHRMPMILPRDEHGVWLDPDVAGDEALVTRAVAASEVMARAVRIIEPPAKVDVPPTLF